MRDFPFSQEQLCLIESRGSSYVEACPGAGKTQAVVQRFIERPNMVDRRGVALLSFTRAATDEARQRAVVHPELLEAPNFLGTIDSFINRFVVTPPYGVEFVTVPTFRDTWSSAPGTSFIVDGLDDEEDVEFQLDWYDFDGTATPTLSWDKVPYTERATIRRMPCDMLEKAAQVAAERWHGLTAGGFVSCSLARLLMRRYLDDRRWRSTMSELVSARFSEVIIDEIQDCADDDLYLLEFLRDAGVNLVMVGDMDQSIFGFRMSTVDRVRALTATVPSGQRLNGNYRSSPNICKLVDSLRFGNSGDDAVGPHQTDNTPVFLLHAYDLKSVHSRVRPILQTNDLTDGELIYLAHAGWAAQTCAGASEPAKQPRNRLVRFASAATRVIDWSSEGERDRQKALQIIHHILRDLATEHLHNLGDAAFYDALGVSQRCLYEGGIRLATLMDPRQCDPRDYVQAIRRGLAGLGWDSWVNAGRLRAPLSNDWPPQTFHQTSGIRWSSIHQFKGLQSPAVGLVIPAPPKHQDGPSGVESWRDGKDDELRRVLYVGASRAQRLLVIIARQRHEFQILREIIQRDQINCVVQSDR
jgi:DNA helicase-2/ATP-dependent DNA helicase PcrA